MKKNRIAILIIVSMAVSVFFPLIALASDNILGGLETIREPLGLPDVDLMILVSSLMKQFFGLMGILFTILILYAGFLYLTSMGNDETVKKAKQTIFSGIIGLLIIFTSFSIASFIINSITNSTI